MLGVASADIADGSEGYINLLGEIRNLNTSAFTVGTVLFIDPATPGNLTATEPQSPELDQPVAIVTRSHASTGILFVRMWNQGVDLNEVHDVAVTDPATGEVLIYNGTSGNWENGVLDIPSTTAADTPPSGAETGDTWYNSTNGKFYVFYDNFWVEVVSNIGTPSLTSISAVDGLQAELDGLESALDLKAPINNARLTGSIGINTSSPAQSLHVNNGRARITGSSGDASGVLELQSFDGGINYIYKLNGGGTVFSNPAGITMTIDSAGRITTPSQPAIFLDGNDSAWRSESPGNVKKFNVSASRGGMSWNATDGRVTVPASGWYHATFVIYQAANTTMRRHIRVNGGIYRSMLHTYAATNDAQSTQVATFYCNANDYVEFFLEYQNNIYYGAQHTYATIHFLG
jgi:hypothetical protein